jgi:carboxymethylenebutenolidase
MMQLGKFEQYLVEEFYDDYRAGLLPRRSFVRRVAFITGSMGAAAAAMAAVGCGDDELPAADEPIPAAAATVAAAESRSTPAATGSPAAVATVAGARSPLSVPEGDPLVAARDVTFPAGTATIGGYLARPAAPSTAKRAAVLVCHENAGLTPHIRDVARRFAKANYVALALDLLAREGGTAQVERDRVPGLLTTAGAARHVADFSAAADYLRTQQDIDGARLAMIGFCFGGGITWEAATRLPLKAAVPFYGPAPNAAGVPNIKAAVLGVYAEQDTRINAGMADLGRALTAAGVRHELKVYPGVNHAFHNDTGARYEETQATQAWRDTLAWFERYL